MTAFPEEGHDPRLRCRVRVDLPSEVAAGRIGGGKCKKDRILLALEYAWVCVIVTTATF